MSKNYFQPVRMESQFNDAKLLTGMLDVEVLDGALVTLDGFAENGVYTKAFTAAAGKAVSVIDENTRACELSIADAGDVFVVDLATVAIATQGTRNYRIGVNQIGLKAPANTAVRLRALVKHDTFKIGSDNCTGALTVGQFATVGAGGKFAPATTAPVDGDPYFNVIKSEIVSQGVDGSTAGDGVQAYMLEVASN